MSDTKKALDALEQWQADTRQQIVNDLGRAVMAALRKIGFGPEDGSPEPVRKPKKATKAKKQRKAVDRRQTGVGNRGVAGQVLQEVQKHPGNRGFQLAALITMGGKVVNERTVRTALKRLDEAGRIEQREDGGWYPTKETKE
jgi:hypothetical protein